MRNFSDSAGDTLAFPQLFSVSPLTKYTIPNDGGAGGAEEIDSDFRRLGKGEARMEKVARPFSHLSGLLPSFPIRQSPDTTFQLKE